MSVFCVVNDRSSLSFHFCVAGFAYDGDCIVQYCFLFVLSTSFDAFRNFAISAFVFINIGICLMLVHSVQ